MIDVLFRVDFGHEIGLGHLRRSLSLATALAKWGVTSFFLTGGRSEYSAPSRFEGDVIRDVQSWTADDAKATLEMATRRGSKTIVVDSHEVGADYLAELRAGGLFVIARDDLASYPFPCQMVINGNANARELPYCSSSGDTRFLLGPEYAVLPPEFWEMFTRAIRDEARNVLIILGGADPCNLTPGLLALLNEMPGDFTVTAVVGPFFRNQEEVRTAADRSQRFVKLVDGLDSVCDLMLEADVAISAAGQTLYELICVGCPTVAIQVAPNQEGQLKALAEAGCVRTAGSAEEGNILLRVREALLLLLSNPTIRATMTTMGQRLVDGRGAERVAQAIRAAVQ